MNTCRRIQRLLFALGITGILPFLAAQDDGPRCYWMAPSGTTVLNAFLWQTDGNARPFGGSDFDPDVTIDATMGIAGYNSFFDLWGRSTSLTLWAPYGSSEGAITGVGTQRSSGFGDVYWGTTFNLRGMPALGLEEFMEHVPGNIIGLGLGGELPTGEYDSGQDINMGQNRYSFRASLPMVFPLGDWEPGKFTTIEIMPVVWFYGDNSNAGGQRLSQDPLFVFEAHFTRDFTAAWWGSLDYQFNGGGETALDGVDQGDSQSASFVGVTLGCNLSETASLTLRYQGGLADPTEDLQLDIFRFELNILF